MAADRSDWSSEVGAEVGKASLGNYHSNKACQYLPPDEGVQEPLTSFLGFGSPLPGQADATSGPFVLGGLSHSTHPTTGVGLSWRAGRQQGRGRVSSQYAQFMSAE